MTQSTSAGFFASRMARGSRTPASHRRGARSGRLTGRRRAAFATPATPLPCSPSGPRRSPRRRLQLPDVWAGRKNAPGGMAGGKSAGLRTAGRQGAPRGPAVHIQASGSIRAYPPVGAGRGGARREPECVPGGRAPGQRGGMRVPRPRRAVESGCVRNRPGNQVFFATLQGRPHAARPNPRRLRV